VLSSTYHDSSASNSSTKSQPVEARKRVTSREEVGLCSSEIAPESARFQERTEREVSEEELQKTRGTYHKPRPLPKVEGEGIWYGGVMSSNEQGFDRAGKPAATVSRRADRSQFLPS